MKKNLLAAIIIFLSLYTYAVPVEAACGLNIGASTTPLSSTCTISGQTTEYLDWANNELDTVNRSVLQIGSGKSITLAAGTAGTKTQLIVGNLQPAGGSISIGTNAQIKIGTPIYQIDSDCDGFADNFSTYYTATGSGLRRFAFFKNFSTVDCGATSYSATNQCHIGFSTCYGTTWQAKTSANQWWTAIAMSSTGQYQTAVVDGGQIYVSSDFGVTWTAKESYRSWKDVAVSSNGARQAAVAYNNYIYVSTDYGNTWTAKFTDYTRSWDSIAMSRDDGWTLTAGGASSIYVSQDYGNTWITKLTNAYVRDISMSLDGQYQLAAGGYYLKISNDYGMTWTNGSIISPIGAAVSLDGSIQTIVVDNGQIYVSSNYGVTWTAKDTTRAWRGIAMSSDGSIQAATINGGNVYVSTDYGNTWTLKATGIGGSYQQNSISVSSDGRILTAVDYYGISPKGLIYVSDCTN